MCFIHFWDSFSKPFYHFICARLPLFQGNIGSIQMAEAQLMHLGLLVIFQPRLTLVFIQRGKNSQTRTRREITTSCGSLEKSIQNMTRWVLHTKILQSITIVRCWWLLISIIIWPITSLSPFHTTLWKSLSLSFLLQPSPAETIIKFKCRSDRISKKSHFTHYKS